MKQDPFVRIAKAVNSSVQGPNSDLNCQTIIVDNRGVYDNEDGTAELLIYNQTEVEPTFVDRVDLLKETDILKAISFLKETSHGSQNQS